MRVKVESRATVSISVSLGDLVRSLRALHSSKDNTEPFPATPVDANVSARVRVPEGDCDWSGEVLCIGEDTELTIQWDETVVIEDKEIKALVSKGE